MPNIGNFCWVLFPLLILIGWRLEGVHRWTFLYISTMCLVSTFVPAWHQVFNPPELDGSLLGPALRGETVVFFCMFLCFYLLLLSKIPDVSRVLEGFGWLGVGIFTFWGGGGLVPIFNNPSLGAVTVILCLGFRKRYNLLAGIGVAMLSFSRSGYLAWAVGMGLTYWDIWFKSQLRVRITAWVLALAALGGAVCYAHYENAQRVLMWERFYSLYQWAEWPTIVFGTGPGTFMAWYEPWQALALKHGVQLVEQFHHVHNDYLELLADYGIVGVGLIAASFWKALRHASFERLIPLLVFMAVMLIYFPLHYPPTILVGMILFKQAFENSKSFCVDGVKNSCLAV